MNHPPIRRTLAWFLASTLALAGAAHAQQDEAGHMHGPDGRHLAAAETFGSRSVRPILSHHDLKILDTRKPGKEGGAVVEGCDVHSVIYRRGNREAVIHREHNAYEAENGVYGSHMVYREPGEYEIEENVTFPDGTTTTVRFPIWVPPAGGKPPQGEANTGLAMVGVGAAVLLLVLAAYLLGRRSGHRAAAALSIIALLAGIVPLAATKAEDEGETGHMHGPDGRHLAVGSSFDEAPEPLRAYLSADLKDAAVQDQPPYRFRISIENEQLAAADPNLVALSPAAARAIDLQLAVAQSRPLAGGLQTTGLVRPNPDGLVSVSSRVSGRVVRVNVAPGQRIPAGHVVAIIDSAEIAEAQATLTRARSELGQAEAARGRFGAEIRRAESQVAEAEAGLERVHAQHAEAVAELQGARVEVDVARSKADSARAVLDRQRQLAATGAFTLGPLETARAGVATIDGELRSARTSLVNLESQAARLLQGFKDGVVAQRELEAVQTAVVQGRSRVSTAERQLEIARMTLAREERIRRENLRDAREVEQAQADLNLTLLGIRSAEAVVSRQLKAVTSAEALVASQRRSVQSAKAQVEAVRGEARVVDAAVVGAFQAVRSGQGRLELFGSRPGGGSRVPVISPIGGEVTTRPVTGAQVIEAGETLCSILNTRSVWIESDVFEKDIRRIRLGQRVSVFVEAAPDRLLQGRVSHIGSEVNPETRAVRMRTVVANAAGILKPNMFVRAVIAAGGGPAVTVPLDAVQEQAGEQIVFVQEGAEGYMRRVVMLGPTVGREVVVEKGVLAGEMVVTRGAYQLLAKARR